METTKNVTRINMAETLYENLKANLKEDGFVGFVTIKELMKNPGLAPKQMGVYIILRGNNEPPAFLEKGTGGFFKGKDPNVTKAELESNWISNTPIMYIGKAGGIGKTTTLYNRLNQYMKFGQVQNMS